MTEKEERRRREIIEERIVSEEKLNDLIPPESERRGFITQIKIYEKKLSLLEKENNELKEKNSSYLIYIEELEDKVDKLTTILKKSPLEKERELEEVIQQKEEKIKKLKGELNLLQKKCKNYRQEQDNYRKSLEKKNKYLAESRTKLEMIENRYKMEGLKKYKDEKENIQNP